MRQQFLFKTENELKVFGGSLSRKGKRKVKRPINVRLPIHIVLRAKSSALFRNMLFVEYFLERFSHRFGIKVYRKATVSNHIHLLIKVTDRDSYTRFIRAFTGSLSKRLKIKWDLRPFSRIIEWGKDFKCCVGYVVQNELEAFGVIEYQPRKQRKRLRKV